MLSLNRYVLSPVLVSGFFSFGLASCSPENKKFSQDVFKVPSPKIVRASGEISDVRSLDLAEKRNLDLHDSIDFGAGAPSKIEVISRCRTAGEEYRSRPKFRVHKIFLMQLLPPEILAVDLMQTPSECSIEFAIYNASGSNHIFKILNVNLTDSQPAQVRVERENMGSPTRPSRIVFGDLKDIRIRWTNQEPSVAQIICQDLFYRARPFSEVMNIADFDLRFHELYSRRPIGTLERHPIQKCRLVIRQNSKPVAISPLFELLLPRQPLQITSDMPLNTSAPKETAKTTKATDDFFQKRSSIVFAQFKIYNPEPARRWIRISKKAAKLNVEVFLTAHRREWLTIPYSLNWYHLSTADQQPTTEDKDSSTYLIEPHASLTVNATLMPKAKYVCFVRVSPYFHAAGIRIHAPQISPEIAEIDMSKNTIERLSLNFTAPLTISKYGEVHGNSELWLKKSALQNVTPSFPCEWH